MALNEAASSDTPQEPAPPDSWGEIDLAMTGVTGAGAGNSITWLKLLHALAG
jgi:hypothetical protein